MRSRFVVCPVYVGRDPEIAALRGIAGSIHEGGRTLLVCGEAGVGKSRMAGEAMAIAQQQGFLTLSGHCARGAVAPYAPITAALRRHTRTLDPETLRDCFSGAAQLALTLLPEVGLELGFINPSRDVIPDDLDAAVWQLFARLCARQPVLLLIEDIQWAGADMLRLLAGLIRETEELPLWVIATYRTDELRRGHPLTTMLGDLARERRYEEFRLEPLGSEAVHGMVTAILGNDSIGAGFADAVARRTGGNPFFVEEMCRALVERGRIDGAIEQPHVLEEIELPQTVAATLLERVRTLDVTTIAVLRIAAVAGLRLDPNVIVVAAGISQAELDRVIVAGLEHQLLVERRTGETREYAFRHALTREALLTDLVGPDRSEAHRRVAEALAYVYDSSSDLVAPRLADLFAEAGMPDRARTFALQAARRAVAAGAPADAAQRYGQAVKLWLDHEHRTDVLVEAAEAAQNPEHVELAVRFAEEARERARAAGDSVAAARAVAVMAWARRWAGDGDGAIELYTEALNLLAGRGDIWELRALISLVHRHALRDEVTLAQPLLERATLLARQLGDPKELARLNSVRGYLSGGRQLEEAYAGALERAQAAGDRAAQAKALTNSGWSFLAMGEFEKARRLLTQAAEVGQQAAPRLSRWAALFAAGIDAFAGDYHAAIAKLDTWGREDPDIASRIMADDVYAEIHLRRGEIAQARARAEESWQLSRTTHEGLRMVASLALLARTRLADGEEDVEPLFADALRRAGSGATGYLHFMFTPDYARLLFERGNNDGLSHLVARVREMTAHTPGHRPNLAALHACEGLLAAAADQTDAARESLRQSAELYSSVPMWVREAESRLLLADVALRVGDEEEAARSAAEALRIAERIGSPPVAARAAATMRRAGIRVRTSRTGGPASDGSLSGREREVAVLVTQGLSNRQIAGRLFLSERTVRNHVSNILGKLELRRRTDLARWVAEQGLHRDPAGDEVGFGVGTASG